MKIKVARIASPQQPFRLKRPAVKAPADLPPKSQRPPVPAPTKAPLARIQPEATSVLDIIRGIKDETVRPADLSSEDRRSCVSHLGAEGLSVPEIAQVLKCSDRTVTRDRKALQEASRIEHDPQLAGLVAGRLVQEAQTAIDRMRRVAREKDCPHAVRVEAEWKSFDVLNTATQRLQSLGFLPTGVQKLEVEATGDLTVQELQLQVAALANVEKLTGGAPG